MYDVFGFRSSSGTESIPVAKKNLLKEYDLGNVNLSQPNSEGAGTNTECRKEHESEPNNLKACRNKDLSKVDDESRRLVGLIVY